MAPSKLLDGLPEPRVYRPTMEEFRDFNSFVRKIEREDQAHLAGICKVVVPDEYIPRKAGYEPETFPFRIETPLKQVFDQIGDRGCYQTRCSPRSPMTISEYKEMATSTKYSPPKHDSYDELERKYWNSVHFVSPVYGADVTNAITDSDVEEWNSSKLNSVLKYVEEDSKQVYSGVNSPYLYFGMWKATFSWHVEDMDLYAINFIHHGAPKTWYCVPPKYGYLLERAARDLFPHIACWCTSFMRHKTCLIAPHVLDQYGVPYNKVVQEERNVIIVFPFAYHSGFNHGFNIAESTNFATERWIEYGKRYRPCDCQKKTVKFDMGIFIKRFQPELYERWLEGKDIAPHPEDPEEVAQEIRLRARDPVAYARALEDKAARRTDVMTYKLPNGRSVRYDAKTMKVNDGVSVEDQNNFNEWKNDKVVLDIYQHVELSQIKVRIEPSSMRCADYGAAEYLSAILGKVGVSVKELIERGEMYRVGRIIVNQCEVLSRRDDDSEGKENQPKEGEKEKNSEDDECDFDFDSEVDSVGNKSSGSSDISNEDSDPDFGKQKSKKRKKMSKRHKKEKRQRRDAKMYKTGLSEEVEKLLEIMKKQQVKEECETTDFKDDKDVVVSTDEKCEVTETTNTTAPDYGKDLHITMPRSEEGQLLLDIDILLQKGVVSQNVLDALLAILEGLNIIEYKDGARHPVWHSTNNVRESLLRTLERNAVVTSKTKRIWWNLCEDLLEIFASTKGKRSVSLYVILEVLFYPDKLQLASESVENIRVINDILVGLGILNMSKPGRWRYRGPPELFQVFIEDLFEHHRQQHSLKRCSIPLLNLQVPQELLDQVRRTKLLDVSQFSGSEAKLRLMEEMRGNVDRSSLDAAQLRSLDNLSRVCRCGKKVEDPNGSGKLIYTGFKKRSRCKKCAGCTAKKCLLCANCLNPRNKQSCIKKVCLYPVTPRCPCFQ